MGLLEKTLKKAGKTREKVPATPAAKPAEEKRSVGWLTRSLGERASALADKINLEEQYARLEGLASSAPEPPKPSLRDRARRMLTGRGQPHSASPTTESPRAKTERPKMSLRQRAAMLVRKLSGGGEGGREGGGTGFETGGTTGASHGRDESHFAPDDLEDYELPTPGGFPWWAHSDDGELTPHITFGEDAHPLPADIEPARAVADEKSPLAEFTDTIGRITENLKNLHVQLDQGNFIRDVQVEKSQAAELPSEPQLISHHVPIEGAGAVSSTGSAYAGGATAAAQPKAEPRDVFWPRNLPLDMPARDIRINADGTVSVVPGPFQLPYLAEDIAPTDGELSHFTRNLKNAELFIAEGELQLTRIIYERLLAKITDTEAKRKIRANLDALDNYRKSHDWGNFMPVPQWQRNPWQDMKPPQISVSEMPVEAKSITINIDKGIFDVARAAFEQEKKATKPEKEAGAEEKAESGIGEGGEEGGAEAEAAGAEQRGETDRRQGLPDTRGEGAEDRRSGEDRRVGAADQQVGIADQLPEENAAPPPLSADGAAAAEGAGEAAKTAPPEAAGAGAAGGGAEEPPAPQAEELPDGVMEPPKIPDMSPDGQAMAPEGGGDEGGAGEEKEEENKVQEIRGVLELKTPDQEDTPFLTLTYDFTKIPHAYRLAKDNGIFEYAYYKYKPMLVKAHQFIKRKQITRALNYYRVIREQQIPTEFRHMVDRNIKDITEYLQKYLVTRQN